MQKRIGEIAQAYERLHFSESLGLIEQTLKKNAKQDKKKNQLTNTELKVIASFRVGALVSLARPHQAHQVFQDLVQPEGVDIMGKENPFLLASIAELFGEQREKRVIELLEKHSPNFNSGQIHRFYLSSRLFSLLSKLFLKEFMTTKNLMFQLGQVYLEYLQNIDKVGLIEYERDGWHKYHPELKNGLKLVNMFLQKCLKTAIDNKEKQQKEFQQKESKVSSQDRQKLMNQIKTSDKIVIRSQELKLKIAINEGRVQDAIKLYHVVNGNTKQPFKFIRSILHLKDISEDKALIDKFYFSEMSKIFRANLNLVSYTPFYDYYHEFLLYLISNIEREGLTKEDLIPKELFLQIDHLYIFESCDFLEVFDRYYCSLYNEYSYLSDKQNPNYGENKKSDYYKICIKGLLLQLIYINNYVNNEQNLVKYLKEYTTLFGNTLTYAHELKSYWKLLIEKQIITLQAEVLNDSSLIQQINFVKINLAVRTTSVDSFEATRQFNEFIQLYTERVKGIEKNRKLQKGQRYISDEFITIISDYIRAYIQKQEDSNKIDEIVSLLLNELEFCIEVSPFNADLKFRLIYFLSSLNHHQRLIQVYMTNDIKSVQMETLGYWFLKPVIEFGVWEHYDHFIDRMIRSYHQNQRETSEYGMKALKAGELDRVEEYLCYRSNILNSYNSIIINFLLYHRYRFEPNSEYYLLKINDSIAKFKAKDKPITFNADTKLMNNELFPNFNFAEFYGLYNSFDLLHKEVNVYLHEQNLINSLLDRKTDIFEKNLEELLKLQEGIRGIEIGLLYNFDQYTFYEQELKFTKQNSKKTIERNAVYLQIFKNISQIRISNILLASYFKRIIKGEQQNVEEQNKLMDKVRQSIKIAQVSISQSGYRERIRALALIRRSIFQSYNLLSVFRQLVVKNKKLKAVKEPIESTATKLMEELFNFVINLPLVDESKHEITSKFIIQRNEALERQMSLDSKQAKRIISKYQNLYKQ